MNPGRLSGARSRNGVTVLTVCAAAGALLLSACSSSSSGGGGGGGGTGGSKIENLQVDVSNSGTQWVPIGAMIKDGIAKKHHLNVKLTVFQSGSSSATQVFAGGTGDLLMAGIDSPVNYLTKKALKVSVIGDIEQQNPFVLVAKKGSDLTDAAALKGKTVGISGAAGFSDYSIRALLSENSVNVKDVKLAALGPGPTQIAALMSGHADAAMIQSPAYEQQLAAGKIQVIHNFRLDGPTPSILAMGRSSEVKKDPQKYSNFLAAWKEEMAKMTADPAYALTAANDYLGSTSTPASNKLQLGSFLGGIWSTDAVFNEALYTSGKKLLINSGEFKASNFPTFAEMTGGFSAGSN